MSLLHWFTRNWADTDQGTHPDLAPLDLPCPLPLTFDRIREAIQRLPRWRIESVDAEAGLVRATCRSFLWRFVDDVTIRLEATPQGTRVHARSQSRIGKGDFGQNRRNLLKLFHHLKDGG